MRDVANKKNFIKSTYFLIVLVFCLVGVTYSWYSMMVDTQIDEVEMSTPDANSILVSYDGSDWISSVTTDFETEHLNPICGNGVKFFDANLSLKEIDNDNGVAVKAIRVTSYNDLTSTINITNEEYTDNAYIISDDFYIKYDAPSGTTAVILSSESDLTPANTSTSALNPSLYTGNVSSAMRVGIYLFDDVSEKFNLIAIWFPNAYFKLNEDYTFDDLTTIPTKTDLIEEKYYLADSISNNEINTTVIETDESGYTTLNDIKYIWDTTITNVELLRLDAGDSARLRISVWLEGTDRECSNAFLGGVVKLNFKLGMEEINED